MRQETPPRKGSSQEAREMGAALRALRLVKGLTQDDAATAMGVTRTAWQNYESGRALILRTDMQERLARSLSASRLELLEQLRTLSADNHSALEQTSASIHAGPGRHQAVFPTGEGDVIISYPSGLSDVGRRRMLTYLQVFAEQFDV